MIKFLYDQVIRYSPKIEADHITRLFVEGVGGSYCVDNLVVQPVLNYM